MKNLTTLQIANTQLIKDVLAQNGITEIDESKSGVHEAIVLLKAKDIEVFLYCDGEANMNIFEEGKLKNDYRYELPDFDDEGALIKKLISDLREHLRSKRV